MNASAISTGGRGTNVTVAIGRYCDLTTPASAQMVSVGICFLGLLFTLAHALSSLDTDVALQVRRPLSRGVIATTLACLAAGGLVANLTPLEPRPYLCYADAATGPVTFMQTHTYIVGVVMALHVWAFLVTSSQGGASSQKTWAGALAGVGGIVHFVTAPLATVYACRV